MRIRQGFVSNSSACSFYCHLCDEEIIGWELQYDECPGCGHDFCRDHFRDGVLPDCPVCSLATIPDQDKYQYALRQLGTNDKQFEQDMRAKFANYDELCKWFKENRQ